MISPTLAAAAVGQWLGMTQEEIAEGVGHFVNSKMRMDTVRCGDGVIVLNDTYNANPQSMRAALEVLSKFDGDYKVAVLGDMLELGDLGPALHESVGQFVVTCGIDCLVAVGTLAENIYNAAQAGGKVECYYRPTKEEAKAVLDQVIRSLLGRYLDLNAVGWPWRSWWSISRRSVQRDKEKGSRRS